MKKSFLILIIAVLSCTPEREKILYINSYHRGYAPSDEVEAALTTALAIDNIELKKVHLDAKRSTESELQQNAADAWSEFISFQPDVVLVSDDNAVQSFVVPYVKRMNTPILFCGVNWSADRYELPKEKVSGMLEVLPVEQCVSLIRRSGVPLSSITILSEQSLGEVKNKAHLVPLFESLDLEVRYVMVQDIVAWKMEFKQAQTEGNVIFLPTNGAITGWDTRDVKDFVLAESKVPSFTCDAFMIDYCAFGIMKIPAEQGRWLAEQTRAVLDGQAVSGIPLEKNKTFDCLLNETISEKIGLVIQLNEFTCKRQRHVN